MTAVRAVVSAAALIGADAAHRVIAEHLRSDVGGRCLACGDLEPCRQRDTAHAALFGHDRQLPRRRPFALVGPAVDFAVGGAEPFRAFAASRSANDTPASAFAAKSPHGGELRPGEPERPPGSFPSPPSSTVNAVHGNDE